ncbi:MAG: PUR family DNA/RNA-binding protein [Candidatus Azobacteroides sp.]|nr:PUR family DNA/RNA-binding protein [Candidatus Azobacteroides sp.]
METRDNTRTEKNDIQGNDIVLSKVVNAGKRIYYLDVKQDKKGELFLAITESKKVAMAGEQARFERHKIFLYKEDFDKFTNALHEMLAYIQKNNTVNFVPPKNPGKKIGDSLPLDNAPIQLDVDFKYD